MQVIQKLIYDARELESESKKGEQALQDQYEAFVSETNKAVKELMSEVATKAEQKAEADQAKVSTHEDIEGVVSELEGLAKYNSEMHTACDFLIKNFNARQEARSQEMEALQQAKQILNGASMA